MMLDYPHNSGRSHVVIGVLPIMVLQKIIVMPTTEQHPPLLVNATLYVDGYVISDRPSSFCRQ